MKKFLTYLVIPVLMVSCGPKYSGPNGEKTQKDSEMEFLKTLSEESKSEVISLADECMELLKAGQIDKAVGMIYVLSDNTLYFKSAEYTKMLVERFHIFPVVDYKLEYSSFSTQGNNDISYIIDLMPKASENDNVPTMKLMFNPVLIDGTWYLTFKDGSQSSKALPVSKQINDMAPAPEDIKLNKR